MSPTVLSCYLSVANHNPSVSPTADMHQNARFCILTFKNFPGVTPPDPHCGALPLVFVPSNVYNKSAPLDIPRWLVLDRVNREMVAPPMNLPSSHNSPYRSHYTCYRYTNIHISLHIGTKICIAWLLNPFAPLWAGEGYTPFTRSSRHQANVEETSSKHWANMKHA